MNLGDNFVQEGLAYRITPFTTTKKGVKNFDTEKTYNNVMNRFKFGGLEKPGLYIDETVMRMCYTHRHLFAQLALQLIAEGKTGKALEVLHKAEKVLPSYNVPNTIVSGSLDIARAYALVGKKADAKRILNEVWANAKGYADYYVQLTGSRFDMCQMDCMKNLYYMQSIADVMQLVDSQQAVKWSKTTNAIYAMYQAKGGQPVEVK